MRVKLFGEETPERVSEKDGSTSLKVNCLSKSFGSGENSVTAVDGVSFSIKTGEVVGLLGPNGAGKTTLIKSILGLVKPDTGDVRINDIDTGANPQEAYRHVGAMLEGARNDYWRLTVRENLRYFASIGGKNPDKLKQRHEELLDHLGLSEKADKPVRELSRGMKQKVSLASALAKGSSVVFLDEPTLGLDVESSLALRRELTRLANAEDFTIVLSSHDMDVIEDICDRVIIMRDGKIIENDTIENLLKVFEQQRYEIVLEDIDENLIREMTSQIESGKVCEFDDQANIELANDEEFYNVMWVLQPYKPKIVEIETITPNMEDIFVNLTSEETQ